MKKIKAGKDSIRSEGNTQKKSKKRSHDTKVSTKPKYFIDELPKR